MPKHTPIAYTLYSLQSRIVLLGCFLLSYSSFSQEPPGGNAPPPPNGGFVRDVPEVSIDNKLWLVIAVLFAVSWGISKTKLRQQKQGNQSILKPQK